MLRGESVGCYAARALDLNPIRAIEEEWISVGGEGCTGERQGVYSGKVIGVGKASRQSAWIVAYVPKKCFELAFVRENTVMVARCEEGSGHV